MPPVAVAPAQLSSSKSAFPSDSYSGEDRPAARTPVERIQDVLAGAYQSGQPAVIDGQIAADTETLVERLRKLKARGGMLAELALGPALAQLHVRARLAG